MIDELFLLRNYYNEVDIEVDFMVVNMEVGISREDLFLAFLPPEFITACASVSPPTTLRHSPRNRYSSQLSLQTNITTSHIHSLPLFKFRRLVRELEANRPSHLTSKPVATQHPHFSKAARSAAHHNTNRFGALQ